MASIFTKLINGNIPGHLVAQNEQAVAFLDINPLHEGHVLVVPRKEVDYLFDLPEKEYHALWAFSKKVAHAVGKAITCQRVGVAVIGLEVPHAHIHLIPINSVQDIDFSRPKLQFSQEELATTAQKISAQM